MRSLFMIFFVAILSACATTPSISSNQLIWHDEQFAIKDNSQIIPQKELFRLDDTLLAELKSSKIQTRTLEDRVDYFLSYFYRLNSPVFPYQGHHSTIPKETWKNLKGDCISLTLLSYSIGKALNFNIYMQAVKVPIQVDRYGKFDYLNEHVNAIIYKEAIYQDLNKVIQNKLTIDYSPDTMFQRPGIQLNENAITARFYNNLAVENMNEGNLPLSYAYFKAAILIDPTYDASFSNLAVLYQNNGLRSSAISLLEYAVRLNPDNFLALRALLKIYEGQGNKILANEINLKLQETNKKNPYYWLGKGLLEMQEKNYVDAIKYLNKVQEMTQGFSEVHQNLASAYFQLGDIPNARIQLGKLKEVDPQNPKLMMAKKYLSAN
jgi:tetratricopeptide (TPR) repeat protein